MPQKRRRKERKEEGEEDKSEIHTAMGRSLNSLLFPKMTPAVYKNKAICEAVNVFNKIFWIICVSSRLH
jgi:hypothetical protein